MKNKKDAFEEVKCLKSQCRKILIYRKDRHADSERHSPSRHVARQYLWFLDVKGKTVQLKMFY
jgi:hypothetical protein